MKILDSRWTTRTFLGCLFFILHGCLLLAPLTESHIVNPSSAILLPRRILTHEKVLRMGHHSLSPHTRQLRLAAVQQQISRSSRQAPPARALYSAPDIPTPEVPALYSAPGVVDERSSQNDNDQDKVTTEVYLQDDEFEDENSSESVRYGVPTENYNDMMIDDEETSMEQDSQSQTESPQPDLRYLPPSNNDTDSAEMDDSTENSFEAVTVKEPSEKYGPPQESGKSDVNMKPALPKQEMEMDLPPGYLPPVYNPPKAQAGKAAAYDLKETEDFGQRPPDSGYNTIHPSLNGKANNGLSNEQQSDSARNQVTNEDEFEGLNEKIVDAELLNRVKQIIDDHEQQQRTAGSPNSNLGHGTDIQYLPPRSGNGSPSGHANTPTQDVNQSSNVPKIDIQKAVLSHHYTDAEPQSGPNSNNLGSHEENRINEIAGRGQAYLPPRPLTNSPPSGYSNQIDTVQYELPKFEHQNSISSYWPSTSASSVASTAPQSSSGSYYYDSHSGQSTPRPNYGVPLAPVLTLESYTIPNNVQTTGYNAYSGAASQPATGEYLPPYEADSSNRVDDAQSNGGSVPSTLLLSPSSTYFTYQNVGNFDSSPASVPTSLSTEFSLPSQEYSSHPQNNLLYNTGLPSNQYFYQSQNPGDSVPHYYSGDTLSSTYSSSAFQRIQRRATPSSYSYIHRGVSHG